ncbi:MAG: GNAT family N-acetyltransferase [Gammaproteobacteria bacterium]|nr:GNAT family N-acetyltransferase [Gammaproteobacteria bacterium]
MPSHSAPAVLIRAGARADASEINRIYNHYVLQTTATFDLEPWSLKRRENWLNEFSPPHFLLVAETPGVAGKLAGFACNHTFRAKAAYCRSTEVTAYTDGSARGAGRALYSQLLERISATEMHRAYGLVVLPNPASVALHRHFGFRRAGTLREVGYKFGRYHDIALFEKVLESRAGK